MKTITMARMVAEAYEQGQVDGLHKLKVDKDKYVTKIIAWYELKEEMDEEKE